MSDINLLSYIKNGPPKDAGTNKWMIGSLLYWRHWMISLIGIAELLSGLFVAHKIGPFEGIMFMFVIMNIAEPKAMKISPKYTIEKNY